MGVLAKIKKDLKKKSNREKAAVLQRFFKTGPGEYAEGDVFLGIKMPDTRQIAGKYSDVPLDDIKKLLKARVHEERMTALLIMVSKFKKGNEKERKELYRVYLDNTENINNWDLVDATAEHVVGAYLEDKEKKPLYRLVGSSSMWERRISVLSTFRYIKKHSFDDALRISEILIDDKEDLIHKAVGWMLREIGKRDIKKEKAFLERKYKNMPRTMLRYAIEKFPEKERQAYLKGKV